LALSVVGCKSAVPEQAALLAIADGKTTPELGLGYDDFFGRIQGPEACFTGKIHKGNPESHFNFEVVTDWTRSLTSLHIHTEAEAAWDIFNFGEKSDIRSEFTSTSLTSTAMVRSIKYFDEELQEAKYKDGIEAPADDEARRRFRDRCGNNYVKTLRKGSLYLGSIKFIFSSESVKKKMNLEASVGATSIASLKAQSELLTEDERRRTSIVFNARALGAYATENLRTQFNGCTLDNWAACETSINQMVEFAQTGFQPTDDDSKFYLFDFAFAPYANANGENLAVAEIPDDVATRYDALAKKALEYDRDLQTVTRRLGADMLDEQKQSLIAVKDTIQKNISRLSDNMRNCSIISSAPSSCQAVDGMHLDEGYKSSLQGDVLDLVSLPPIGDAGDPPYSVSCKGLVRGVQGSSGSILNQLVFQCDDYTSLPPMGNKPGGNSIAQLQCPQGDGQVMTGIRLSRSTSRRHTGWIATFRAVCCNRSDVEQQKPNESCQADANEINVYPGAGTPNKQLFCPRAWRFAAFTGAGAIT
jgi:hypothetical protein